MNRKRKYNDIELIDAVKSSISIREVLGKLGKAQQGGGSYNQIKQDIQRLNLSTSHFMGCGHLKGKTHTWSPKISLEEILIEHSSYTNRTFLKSRLIKEKLIENKCSECGLGTIWNDKQIVMILDHINGINNDNRLENLRMICPNCNSQQKTFAGRNKRYRK